MHTSILQPKCNQCYYQGRPTVLSVFQLRARPTGTSDTDRGKPNLDNFLSVQVCRAFLFEDFFFKQKQGVLLLFLLSFHTRWMSLLNVKIKSSKDVFQAGFFFWKIHCFALKLIFKQNQKRSNTDHKHLFYENKNHRRMQFESQQAIIPCRSSKNSMLWRRI